MLLLVGEEAPVRLELSPAEPDRPHLDLAPQLRDLLRSRQVHAVGILQRRRQLCGVGHALCERH